MPYVVLVDDNFHHMDEDERYRLGAFAHAEVAIGHCRRIVEEYLASAYKSGMSAQDLWDNYRMFGEDPFIQSIEAPPIRFSAWDYARERCSAMCGTTQPAVHEGSASGWAAARRVRLLSTTGSARIAARALGRPGQSVERSLSPRRSVPSRAYGAKPGARLVAPFARSEIHESWYPANEPVLRAACARQAEHWREAAPGFARSLQS